MINMYTKFEVSSLNSSRDILDSGTIKRNLSKSAFSEGVGHFERKF